MARGLDIAVLGAGSWGTAIAVHLALLGHEVSLWGRSEAQRNQLKQDRENQKYLPGLKFPDLLKIQDCPKETVKTSGLVVFAVPSHALRETLREMAPALPHVPVVNLAKGLEEHSLNRMLEVVFQELNRGGVSLVGPSHAEEVALHHPTALVATGIHQHEVTLVQEAFTGNAMRVYTNADTVGVELAVAMKNVIALAAGVSAGLGFGDNTLGSLITRGLAENTRLGVMLGAQAKTFFGLAGVGDLVTTCCSRHSRNRRIGEAIGKGHSLEDSLQALGMVAEGVRTTAAAKELADRLGVEMPIVNEVHAVLFEGKDPSAAIESLMSRQLKAEAL
ncbi:MAG: NAD(P)-dependent glycerol-3-phosphate dehydrogenase [Candidatus Eisenbacteria bacterium]|uniref:Glycerol-3-phosphate dehydrogenase [NAD(P)+] n=1 Tax=Eiseniibacteriota bacterium TaxID=2212470 RepID=A0A7Y2H184_UNCEI|nr:NAD(P)-dependent glycerol-3-phosphate dehydrogenase [Candidatus Eisenbacteria bacterium]